MSVDASAPPSTPARDDAAPRPLGTRSVAGLSALAAAVVWLLAAGLRWAFVSGHLPLGLTNRAWAAAVPDSVEIRPGPVALTLVVVATVAGLVTAAVAQACRRGTVSAVAVVLSGWFAACLAGVAGATVGLGLLTDERRTIVATPDAIPRFAAWGLVWGWVVGLVLLLALRHGAPERPGLVRPRSVVAAAVAGLVASVGWAVSGWLLARVLAEVGTQTTARLRVTELALILLQNNQVTWFGPVFLWAYLAGAALIGVVVGTAVVLAARGTAPRRGGGVLVLVVWWASTIGCMVSAAPVAVGVGRQLPSSGMFEFFVFWSMWLSSGWGLLHGWVVGLVAWCVLRLTNRAEAPVVEEPTPGDDVCETAPA